jgi:hypothetical protein
MGSVPHENNRVERSNPADSLDRRRPTRTPIEAIAFMCRQCIFDPAAGDNWRAQVEACHASRCPLHEHRPTTSMVGP